VPYGTVESVEVVKQIYTVIRDNAYAASAELAAEKGAFPKYDREKYLQGRFVQRLPEAIRDRIAEVGIRNAVLLTQAPTGTTSLLSGVSSGIEPVYDFAMRRRDRTGEHILYHPLLQQWREAHPSTDYAEKPHWFVSANDLTPEEHVRIQATVQAYTDSSISKTVNAPNDHTVDQVQILYMMAYDLGCKGVTYFRDGCREGVLSHIEPPSASVATPSADAIGDRPRTEAVQLGFGIPESASSHLFPRPRAAEGVTYRMPTPLGTMFTTITRNPGGQPFEVFMQVGKAGSDTASVTEALGRLISLILRLPSLLPPSDRLQEVVDQLSGIGGGRQLGMGRNRVRSLPDAVAQVLAEFLGNDASADGFGLKTDQSEARPSADGQQVAHRMTKADLCPECGDAALVYEEGCQKCYSCGFSEC
jgi:ribonucleoside-diphosphate reductase alpha chain